MSVLRREGGDLELVAGQRVVDRGVVAGGRPADPLRGRPLAVADAGVKPGPRRGAPAMCRAQHRDEEAGQVQELLDGLGRD